MTGMERAGKIWDGYEWVIPVVESLQQTSTLHEPSSRRYGAAADAFQERQEEQRKLVALTREVGAVRAQRARVEHRENKLAECREIRQHQDELTGRAAHMRFLADLKKQKVEPADNALLVEVAKRVNNACLAEMREGGGAEATRNDLRHCWVKLAKEMDQDESGRIGFDEFLRVVKSKLRRDAAAREAEVKDGPRRGRRGSTLLDTSDAELDGADFGMTSRRRRGPSREYDEIERLRNLPQRITRAELLQVWLVLDHREEVEDDGRTSPSALLALPPLPTGHNADGYITKDELIAFLRHGMPPGDVRLGERKRDKTASRRRQDHSPNTDAADHSPRETAASLHEWQCMMKDVEPVSDKQLMRLSRALNERLEPAGHSGGWYPLFKAYDHAGAGRIEWNTFFVMVRELMGGVAEVAATRATRPERQARRELSTPELRAQVRGRVGSVVTVAAKEVMNSGAKIVSTRTKPLEQAVFDPGALQRYWRALDTNLTGHLTLSEFAAFFKRGGSSPLRDRSEGVREHEVVSMRTRVSVQQADRASRTSQAHCAQQLHGERSQLATEALKLEASLRQMKRDDETRAYREQQRALKAKPGAAAAAGSRSARESSQAKRMSLLPAPMTDRPRQQRQYAPRTPPPAERYLQDEAEREHRRAYATFRMISQRNPASERMAGRGAT